MNIEDLVVKPDDAGTVVVALGHQLSSNVARGQMATFLVRALGIPPVDYHPFPDIAGDRHERSIEALAAAGLTSGYTDGRFRPGAPVTREQMATFLVRSLDIPPAEYYAPFDDIDGVHADAIDDLYAVGITAGTAPLTYSPVAPVTRGQMATFLARSLDLVERLPVVYPW